MDEQQTPAPEAGDEAVSEREVQASEATENTEGQVETPPAEPEGEKPEGEEEAVSPAKARRERRKAEMERLRKEAREAQEAEAKVKERLAALEKYASQEQPPKEDDFSDYNEYLMALAAHKSTAALDARQKREIEDERRAHETRIKHLQDQEQAEIRENWMAQVQEAKQRYADFEQVVYTARISDGLAGLIAQSDSGADVAYHLGTNHEAVARLERMTPIEQAMELGRLSASISAPRPRTQSKAPDPASPVRGGGGASTDPLKMTPDEYDKWREAGGSF